MKSRVVHDRALLLRGCKRNEVLNLAEIEQSGRSYGRDVASVAIRMPAKQFVVIDLVHGDYLRLLEERRVQEDRGIVTSIAPPWGAALDEVHGLDLRRTTPPIIEVIDNFSLRFPTRKMLFAVQAYEQVSVHSFEPDSHAAGLDRSAQLPHQSKRPEPWCDSGNERMGTSVTARQSEIPGLPEILKIHPAFDNPHQDGHWGFLFVGETMY